MFFASDNWAGVHPDISANLSRHAAGTATAYGDGDLDRAVYRRFNEIFEREVQVFFVATGTAANALSMAGLNRIGGIALCHSEAHMNVDEFGAMGSYTGGARTAPVSGPLGRMNPEALDRAIRRYSQDLAPAGQPMAVTLTQATEVGTVYSVDDVKAIAEVSRRHKLPLHMDGARFANAIAATGVSPAEMTWKSGVDLISFGATKNGCWMADAVVILNPDVGKELRLLRQRAGQTFSKARFISAQFEAYFNDDLWLRMAGHANQMAAHLAETVEDAPAGRLAWLPQANEVFAILNRETAEKLRTAGAKFYEWGVPSGFDGHLGDNEAIYRFVASFATTTEEIDRLGELLG
ncbi:low specificity L-threonine aldolase [Mesorhizobium sp. M2E.F.Ca.ET.209.01.1.1]|jgi:threonine aldolase|uniref:threonine aldolase family protein n=1 Tax=Mesorhizobium sp. M2E.F.Ca.ET.209.01.1.1 TaxID=2500526 RepID=UPI000FDA2C25|nr:low specificity L-threonine aldolase [Mesorhizobium sp. M2E.F.Ca.ET.209.01.1.1]RWL50110.1 MAG: low specificity L-threonine aldolase [Mesorhizobium sp.]TGS19024.1 low specificity L-threonine aldolase [Mesorhizobium sp. M2E.F.Ca.ET.209.01.1.1]